MKPIIKSLVITLLTGATTLMLAGCASDTHDHTGHNHGASATKPYPLNKCVVSDDAFDHGKPVVFVYEGQEIKLCCTDCRKDFDKDPAKYLSKLTTHQ